MDTERFPINQIDARMEGITSDKTYNKAVRDCNKYGEFLARKYCADIDEQNVASILQVSRQINL